MNDYQTMSIVAAALGAFGIAALGLSIGDAIPSAISALATFGPGFGDIGATSSADVYAAPARAILVVLMVLGRLSIYPVLLAAESAAATVRRRVHL